MSISIQTNVNSLVAQQNLSVTNKFQSQTIAQLTSGYRINQSGDDAAGLAVANKFRSSVAELSQGVANGNDAVAQLQIMDGGMNNISLILDRLKTLATQSASGTFTGNRTTLNSEFQGDLAEIDRQATSIGLNTGGLFAKKLDVYLGAGSGSSALSNAIVAPDLSRSAVDSQSLGMKGMQAVAGVADIGAGSSTSVANILADGTNTGSEATGGSTDFYFTGAGFSDASKVKVTVNLSGVSDTASLVTAFNTAIAAAGTGTSQAGAAFANANIVASVHTDNSGGQQLSFTSSTKAFQVESGDRMANALMGDFSSGTTGQTITTTVTGGLTAASGAFSPTGKTVRIQGAGMSGPVDLTFSSATASVSDAITDLVNKVSSNSDLKAAGISLAGTAGSALVFTSSRGESFSVIATGDATNQLGLGSFVTNSSAGNKVDYNSITGSSYDYGSSVNDQATLQFSVNGAAATAVSVDLTAGDAVAAARKTSVISNPAITTGANDALTFSVDGIGVAATLSGSSAAALTGSGNLFAAAATVTITAASGGQSLASADVVAHTFATPSTFTVAVDGGPAQTVTLSGLYTTGNDYATAVGSQLSGATVSYNGSTNRLSITSNSTGTNSHINVTDGVATASTVAGSAAATGADYTGGGAASFTVAVGGGATTTVNLTTNITDAQAYVTAINTDLAGHGAHAVIDSVHTDRVDIVSDTPGSTATITLANVTGTPLTSLHLSTSVATGSNVPVASYLKLATGVQNGAAGNNQLLVSSDLNGPALVTIAAGTYGSATGTTIQRAVNNALVSAGLLDSATTPTTGVIASLDAGSNNLVLSSSTVGALSSVSIAAPPSVNATTSSALGGSGIGIAAGSDTGGSATAASLAAQIQSAIDTATGTGATNAHATVTVNTDNSISITNDHKGAAHSISAFAGNAAVGGSQFLSTGAAGAIAGLNRTGGDTQNYLNGVFSSDTNLQPAQLTATWTGSGGTAGTLQIASGNSTSFRVNSGSTGSGVVTGTQDLTAGHDWSGGGSRKFRIAVDGGAWSGDITLNTTTTTAAQVLTAVQAALTAASVTGVTASLDSGHHLVFTSDTTGASSDVQVQGPATGTSALANLGLKSLEKTADADLGFGVSGATFTGGLTIGAAANHIIDAGGASSANVGGSALSFSALQFGNDAQAITISGNDANGNQQSTTITLKNIDTGVPGTTNRSGRNIDEAISYLNAQLQASNNTTLQKIVAVKENNSGNQINFVSSLSSFNVSVASTANADGVNGGASHNYALGVVGAGANVSIDTQAGAQAAVSAISAAVANLGTAQAAVGKGQNQLAYSISLAQSQITNFSSAESAIRDANVAQQAANLSKAQVLSQASIAAMAQANSATQGVLALLRG